MKKRWLIVAGAPVLSLSSCCYGTGGCGVSIDVPWDGKLADGGELGDAGFIPTADCSILCTDAGTNACQVADAGLLNCYSRCIGGRAPPGLLALSGVNRSPGSWVARMAELEAAAVHAFALLADELEVHGIDGRAARAAALDEVRHARAVTGLSLRMGYLPRQPRLSPRREARSLEEIAIDNAGEGCGRELFGAAMNAWQAEHAGSPEVREVMASIAADEHAHAQASFDLHAALSPKLTAAQRRRAREAQEKTLLHLAADGVEAPLRRTLGLMDEEQVKRAVSALLDTRRV